MKFRPQWYAQAFVLALDEKKVPEEKLRERLLAVIKRNGDLPHLGKILREAERLVLRKLGLKKVLIESARPVAKARFEELRKTFAERDIVEAKIVPELIAGAKITIDDEWTIDASLKGRLQKLFK